LTQSYQNTQDILLKKSQRILMIISIVVIIEQIINHLNNDKGLRYQEKFDFYDDTIKGFFASLEVEWELQNKENNIINVELCNEFELEFIPSDENFDSYFEYEF